MREIFKKEKVFFVKALLVYILILATMNRVELLLTIFIVICVSTNAASLKRPRRQTYYYPEDLRKYAHTHSGTKIIQATAGRYAPEEWPAW